MSYLVSVVDILGVPVAAVTYAQTLALIATWIKQRGPHQIATVNPEFVMIAQHDTAFMAVLRAADLCAPDGVGLLWAARRLGQHLPERVTGSDLLPLLAERAAIEGWRLFFLGAAPGVAERTAALLQTRYPALQIAGVYGGSPTADEAPALVERITAATPDVLFVAYGAPAQDLWIARYRDQLAVPVMIGVGGAFDHLVGVRRRAPLWVQRLRAEWLFRLITQPWRWRRQLALPRFVWAVLAAAPRKKRAAS